MNEPRKCPNCAALVKTLDMRFCGFCGFCGTEVPGVRDPQPPGPWGDLEARFAALEERASSRRSRRRRRPPSDSGVVAGYGLRALFGLVFAGVAIFIAMQASDGHVVFAVLPILFVLIGLGVAVASVSRAAKVRRAPLRRVPALVVGERTEVSGGGRNSSASTTYHVTLQYESGRRREYEVGGKIVGEVTEGDMGMAYTKAGHLLDFDRVDV